MCRLSRPRNKIEKDIFDFFVYGLTHNVHLHHKIQIFSFQKDITEQKQLLEEQEEKAN